MTEIEKFEKERKEALILMAQDKELGKKSIDWMIHADKYKYTYNYTWLGRPIIKYPNDIALMQEIIWDLKPDVIIETGIAHGGSIIFSASMLELIGKGEVVAVDIDIREHNKVEIEKHPMAKRITMYEGSSTDPAVFAKIKSHVKEGQTVLIVLDSLHTHAHVIDELRLYSDLVSTGSYIICPDTFIEFFPKGYYANRPWDVGNNPYTAVQEFLKENSNFVNDDELVSKLMITEGIEGYLKKLK